MCEALVSEYLATLIHCRTCLVILIYDYFLTLSDEIKYIWPSKWTLVKIGFLMNRYLSLVAIINSLITVTAFTFDVPRYVYLPACPPASYHTILHSCKRGLFVVTILDMFVFASWDVLLAVRVHALWGARRSIGIALGIAFACSSAGTLIPTTTYASRIARTVVVIKDLKVCIPGARLPPSYFVVWLPSLLFETVVFLMTMHKVIGPVRMEVHSIATLMLRDGVIYFITIFSARLANMILFIHQDVGRLIRLIYGILTNPLPPFVCQPAVTYSGLFLLIGLGSAMINRMTLNLRTWRVEETENPPVRLRRHLPLSHPPHAISGRTFPTPDMRTGPPAGTNANRVCSGSRHLNRSDALEPKDDFVVLGSKDVIALKSMDSKV
ncbi:hypothetical protein BS47DRAFT_1381184 [Hydnum rufescens UP504]|uniref:DUF6533 domain-containing protein n=1 Tax=Hydnum rufescens UP504 TaxID=1448309 RepID=A0A9P6B216_9AGAM|nr:hypothetical protein BS47DRAFT_1381184 [Hydnum rufescens UP504]